MSSTDVSFIYKKGSEFKVLDVTSANNRHEYLMRTGWAQTATIDPIEWLETFLNKSNSERKNLVRELT